MQMAVVQAGISAWKDAQQTLESAIRDHPDDADLLRKLLEVAEQTKDGIVLAMCNDKLKRVNGNSPMKQSLQDDPVSPPTRDREKGRSQPEAAPSSRPAETNGVSGLLKRALATRQDSSKDNHLEEAQKIYEQVLKVEPTNAEALDGAAYCHRKLNNLEMAVQLYTECLRVTTSPEGPLYYLGEILYRMQRHRECQIYLKRLVGMSGSQDFRLSALYTLAKSHVSLDDYEEAEKISRSALEMSPNHLHFLFILALVKNRQADYDTSISILEQALRHAENGSDRGGPGSDQLLTEMHDWLAQAHERKRDYRLAMVQLELALKRDPSHVSTLITKGLVHINLKQNDQAEAALKRALLVEKNNALALVRLGYCKLLVNEYVEATQYLQRAVNQRCGTVALPRSVKGTARVYMALALMAQQDVDGALFHLKEARKDHNNFAEVCNSAKEIIVKGECEGLINQLRGISDLDVNLAQAWQLVHLLAKELELDLQDPIQGRSTMAMPQQRRPPGSDAALPKAVGEARGFDPPARNSDNGAGSALRRSPAPGAQALPGGPSPSSAQPQSAARRSWTVEPPNAAAPPAIGGSDVAAQPTGLVPPPENPPSTQDRRRWSMASLEAEKAQAPKSTGQGKLKLALSEQLEYSELSQGECLGTGGFGAVYRGLFKGREVAIKKLFCEDGGNISPLQLEELSKEVAALRSLSHPRLVAFIGACLQPPNLCIVTEYMPNGSLHYHLHKAKTMLQVVQQAKMGLQVTEGVAFLHNLIPPVVHRDLKSLNIVLDHDFNAKICDFGLTQSMEKTHISLKDGGNGGSPRYMAPECYDSKGKITEKVDVWALGCILIEIFGGPLPYDDCVNIQQIVAKVMIDKQLPYIPHHLPRGVRSVVEECLEFDIKARTSAHEAYNRLKRLRLAPDAGD